MVPTVTISKDAAETIAWNDSLIVKDIANKQSYRSTIPSKLVNDVRSGSWLCENGRRLGGERTNCLLKTVFAVNRASASNFENKLKNVILAEFRSFAFLHSQGQKLTVGELRDNVRDGP